MGRVDGKVALITGGARGQGRSHAVRLAEEGADIIVVDALQSYDGVAYDMATQDDLDETVRLVEKTGRRILARQGDVRDRPALQAVLDEGLGQFGHVDIVLANAGIMPPGAPFWQIPEEQWREIIGVNMDGVWNTLCVVTPPMIEAGRGGSIVVTSSGAGLRTAPNMCDYNVSKFAAVALARTAATELAPHRIRCNAIAPSVVKTDMALNDTLYRLMRPDLENPTLEDVEPIFTMFHPIPVPYLEANEISNAVLWLASDESRYVTGIVLPVDCGYSNRP